ncbi:hypothetical protein K458DRAFT_423121 [Lentithecium fluviatile CBS 122367]|uniref:Uncharacterized protein n=1 Tax=Lentithecium fluviatile CBS 122367 TaxID=1168545 RepID=A0A6G1IJL7_9PLEO|nr:hypothetical protein K458DRAFT_423121 [Lentithecium fluviatile CBS 122367]
MDQPSAHDLLFFGFHTTSGVRPQNPFMGQPDVHDELALGINTTPSPPPPYSLIEQPDPLDLLALGVYTTSGVRPPDYPFDLPETAQTHLTAQPNMVTLTNNNSAMPSRHEPGPVITIDLTNDNAASAGTHKSEAAPSPLRENPPIQVARELIRKNLTTLLRTYFLEPHPSLGHPDETLILTALSDAWRMHSDLFYSNPSYHKPFDLVLSKYLGWRQRAIQLIAAYTSPNPRPLPSDPQFEWVYRGAICNELREMRWTFVNMMVMIKGKSKEARNVLGIMLGSVMRLDVHVREEREAVKRVRDAACRLDGVVEELARGLKGVEA